MNRRQFCKIASLAAAAVGLNPIEASGLAPSGAPQVLPSLPKSDGRIAASCRVSILRRECHIDLQSLFLDDPDSGPCPNFTSGETFIFKAGEKCPAGFCQRLWETICSWANAGSRCARDLRSSTTIISCPDGTRPVIVRVDREGI